MNEEVYDAKYRYPNCSWNIRCDEVNAKRKCKRCKNLTAPEYLQVFNHVGIGIQLWNSFGFELKVL